MDTYTSGVLTKLGEKLYEARLSRNITQDVLAAKSGVSRVMISYIETSRRIPSLNTLIRLAWALEMRLDISFTDPDITSFDIDKLFS